MKLTGLEPAVRLVILVLACSVAVLVRTFSVIRFESIIHEFDPWFNYRTTEYLTRTSLADFWNYYDRLSWYPLGRDVGNSVYPGMMITSALCHDLLRLLGLPVHIREVSVFLGPFFAALTSLFTYLLTREVSEREGAGLIAALAIGLNSSYMSRSTAGAYDNECVAIFAMVLTFYTFLRACNLGSLLWGLLSSLSFLYMVACWGGYSFVINIIPLFVLLLLVFGRYTHRVYVAYSVFYSFGTLFAMQVKFIHFLAISSSDHMLSHGTFVILQLVFLCKVFPGAKRQALRWLPVALAIGFGVLFVALQVLGLTRWTGRTLTLLNPTYAKKYIPIVASVAEHRATDWRYFFMSYHYLNFLVPPGLYIVFRRDRFTLLFLGLYLVCGVYFSSIMVRLLLVLAPAVIVVASIGASWLIEVALSRRTRVTVLESLLYVIVVAFLLVGYVKYGVHSGEAKHSDPSVILQSTRPDGTRTIVDDYREGYYWLRTNTDPEAVVMSWWDYGYQITGFANRTTIADGNTWNNTHIATIGLGMSSPENEAHEVMEHLGADYALVIFGGVSGYSGDDINKFHWMVTIGGGVYPHIKHEDYFMPDYRLAIG
jgi:dolichyl-diphosphooligosaccharide--protein glycosyltransferase